MTAAHWKRVRSIFKLQAATNLHVAGVEPDAAYARAEDVVARMESLFLEENPLEPDPPGEADIFAAFSLLAESLGEVKRQIASLQTQVIELQGRPPAENEAPKQEG